MITEFIDSLRCHCPPPFRSYGFHRELAAIHARRQRCRNAWQTHEQNCHQIITDHAPGGDVALLAGAGICFDLPVETLLSRYTEIWLADVAFHISVRRLARRNPAIRLITADITGLLATALPDSLSDIRPVDLWQTEPRIDLVVSANLITQLPLPFLDKRSTPTDQTDLRTAVHRAHLDWLRSFQCQTVLIAETEVRRRALPATKWTRQSSLTSEMLDDPHCNWTWQIAPTGEISRRMEMEMTVAGWVKPPVSLA